MGSYEEGYMTGWKVIRIIETVDQFFKHCFATTGIEKDLMEFKDHDFEQTVICMNSLRILATSLTAQVFTISFPCTFKQTSLPC